MVDEVNNEGHGILRRSVLGALGVAAVATGSMAVGGRPAGAAEKRAKASTANNTRYRDTTIVRGNGPNILMIMADQYQADWLGAAGAWWVKTPNLDRLAENGVLFRRAACNAPVCAPSRAALASGLRCSSVGVLGNHHLYPYHVPTYYQALRLAGYRVGCVGKMDLHKKDHWEGENGDRPLMYHLGFTDPYELEGKQSAAMMFKEPACPYQKFLRERGLMDKFHYDYAGTRRQAPEVFGADSVLPLEAYEDAFIGEHACKWLQGVGEESPWHYFVSFVGPHNPWDAPKQYADLYRNTDMPEAIQDDMECKPEWQKERAQITRNLTRENLVATMRYYAGMITLIDDYIGKMVRILEERGMMGNTVVMFCADHGEMMGDHDFFWKSTFYESALRIPLIVSGAGITARGDSDELVELADLAPTCVELAHAEPLRPMTAKSLVPLLSGSVSGLRDCQISELVGRRMVFDGRHKMIERKGEPEQLYDLEADPKELVNLS